MTDKMEAPVRYCLGLEKLDKILSKVRHEHDLSDEEFFKLEELPRAGMKDLNEAGIFHGDVNEINIMVSPDRDRIYFIDFNNSQLREDMRGQSDQE